MQRFRIIEDPDKCRILWSTMVPREGITDLWEVRDCFRVSFERPLRFVVCENDGCIQGIIPLAWIEETGSWGYFPGETWQGRTWLEKNRLIARDAECLSGMLDCLEEPCELRYLLPAGADDIDLESDETGYLFQPQEFDYRMELYYKTFRWKYLKNIRREIAHLTARGLEYRLDRPEDFELLIELNLSRFGEQSYFHDERFASGFHSLTRLLLRRGWLRMTTVLIGGKVAAVDMGCVYNGDYTLLAGGTNSDFPGVAKLINLHHMERACAERFDSVDFLCGNFSWKSMFHLRERPLYKLSNLSVESPESIEERTVPEHV